MGQKFNIHALALAMFLAAPMAMAATTTTTVALSNTSYSDLGAGPILLGASGGAIVYQIADSQPSASAAGLVQQFGSAPALVQTTAHVWAISSGGSAIVSAGTGITPTGASASGTPTQTSISITTASTTVLAAATATTFLKLCVPQSAANGIWVQWDGATATAATPAEYMAPGQCDSWVKSTGFLPTSQINAIASAAVSVTLIYN